MKRHSITMENVEAIYDEVERRVEIERREAGLNEMELKRYRLDMLQGVYSALMILSDDWPGVRCNMIDSIETDAYWKRLGYETEEV